MGTAPPALIMSHLSPLCFYALFSCLAVFGILGDVPPQASRHGYSDALETQASSPFGFDMRKCGTEKGCFASPEGCENEACSIFLSWKVVDDNRIYFEQSMAVDPSIGTNHWIALGLSLDDKMKSTSVVTCIHYGDSITDLYATYNPGYSNAILNNKYLGLDTTSSKATFLGDRMECEFARFLTVNGSEPDADKVFPLTESYYLQLGNGPADTAGNRRKHVVLPTVTASKVNFTEYINAGGSAFKVSPLLKAHACLMIAAWVLLAGIGIINARYLKPAWEIEIAKLKLWFWVHRTAMTLVLCLTICGFIIIFYEVYGFTVITGDVLGVQSAHPIIGIIVMALALANPIMALFRPHPGTKNRPIFNWAHRCVGESGRILAVVNIMIGFWMPKSALFTEKWMFWIMVAVVCFHCIVEVALFFTTFIKNIPQKKSSVKLEVMEWETGNKESQKKSFKFQTAMLFVYGIVMLGCSIAIFVGIGQK